MDWMAFVRLAGGIMFTPLSDDVLMMGHVLLGVMEGTHPLKIWLMTWPVFVIAFTWFYLIARFFREVPFVKKIMKSRFLSQAETILERRGGWAIGLSFFLPGVRHPIHYVAGLLNYPLGRYVAINVAAAGVYTGVWTFLIVRIGKVVTWSSVMNGVTENPMLLGLGVIGGITVLGFLVWQHKRGRSLMMQVTGTPHTR